MRMFFLYVKRILAVFAVLGICFCIALFFSPKPLMLDSVSFGKEILDRNGRLLRMTLSDDQKYRIRISLDKIAPEAIDAVLQYEDKHFYSHPGVNPFSVGRALLSIFAGKRKVGASTISMQVARLRFGLKTSDPGGKILQMWRALQLERHYSKAEILEAYFNLAPYGGNIEGIEAAARIYFNQPASKLTEIECQALAIVPQNPIARNPVNGRDFNKARQILWANAGRSGNAPPIAVSSLAKIPFFARHLSMQLSLGQNRGEVNTSIELDLQRQTERILSAYIARRKAYGITNAAALLIDSRNMHVLSLIGSASFFNNEIQGQIDGTLAKRSPGSTLKPFIYGLALDQGLIHPKTILPDSPRSFSGYDPQNFDHGFQGPVSASEALKNSRNLPAIFLAGQLAYPGLFGFLQKADITFPREQDYYGLALALGGVEISMRELASLYAMLANGGLWQPLQITTQGEWVAPKRLLSREAAYLVLNMLARDDAFVLSNGKRIPLVYKTGTSNGFRDAWTCGIVGQYVLAVWVGNFDNRSNPLFVGAESALPLFAEIANLLAYRYKLTDLFAQPVSGMNIAETDVCLATGDFEVAHCPDKGKTWIIPGVSPVASQNILRPVFIDELTGLRLCGNGKRGAKEVWMEFWPTDMLEIFARAGIHKPTPPAWHPQCADMERNGPGKAPRILYPKKNVVYKKDSFNSKFNLPLQAACEADVNKIYWYAGNEYLGSSKPGKIFFWQTARTGKTKIRVVDEAGRSASQDCLIELAQ